MSDNVVPFTGDTISAIPPEKIIGAAAKADLEEVIIIGWTKNGELYCSSSTGDIADNLLMIELFKKGLLSDG